METFLLNIVLVLLLVIVLLAFILRLVFRLGNPYAGAILPTAAPLSSNTKGSGLIGTLFIILLGSLAFLYLSQYEEVPDKAQPPSYNHYEDRKPPNSDVSGHLENENLPESSSDKPEPLIVHQQDFLPEKTEIKRYNQAPYEQPASFYAIQVGAFSDELYAKRSYQELRNDFKDLQIIYFFEDEAPFKLVIGEFQSREAAKKYQRIHDIIGYIRYFEY
jgi:hypothetical protein